MLELMTLFVEDDPTLMHVSPGTKFFFTLWFVCFGCSTLLFLYCFAATISANRMHHVVKNIAFLSLSRRTLRVTIIRNVLVCLCVCVSAP